MGGDPASLELYNWVDLGLVQFLFKALCDLVAVIRLPGQFVRFDKSILQAKELS